MRSSLKNWYFDIIDIDFIKNIVNSADADTPPEDFLWQMQTFAQMGRDPSRAPSNFFITETEGSKSPKMRREAPDWKHEKWVV